MNNYEYILASDGELYHHGIKGMKWGKRRYQNSDGTLTAAGKKRYGEKLKINDTDTAVTKKVKGDYNRLSDDEFVRKYQTDKQTYAKRVEKYGDPYANSPMAKYARNKSQKELNKINKRNDAKMRALDKDIDSFKGHEKGIYDKKGRELLSAKDVKDSVSALKQQKAKYAKKVTDEVKKLSRNYRVTYDVATGEYRLDPK